MTAQRHRPIAARPARRPAPRLGRVLAKLLSAAPQQQGPSVRELAARWPEIVGVRIARSCRPTRIAGTREDGVLHVDAPGAAAVLIEADAARIISKVNAFLGHNAIGRLSVRRAPFGKAKHASGSAPAGISPKLARAIDESLAPVDDPRLKAALSRLGRAVHGNGRTGSGAASQRKSRIDQ